METSITTTSGSSVCAQLTAVKPSLASPTTSMSGCALISSLMPSRTVSWSSAIMIRRLLMASYLLAGLIERHTNKDSRPLARSAFDFKRPANESGALAYVDQAKPAPRAGGRCLIDVKSYAVVLNDQHHLLAAPLKHHFDQVG